MRLQHALLPTAKTNGHRSPIHRSALHRSAATNIKTELEPQIYDGVPYIYITWERMGEYNFELAQKILASGQTFDSIIALAKGGWTWARAISDYLCIDHVCSIRYKSYTNINENPKLQMVQPLSEPVGDQRVLIFDDVIDSGYTLRGAKSYLKSMGVKRMKVATLAYKPRSILKPDFYAFQTSAWIAFPHEVREFIDQSYARWSKKGTSKNEICDRFYRLGIPRAQVKYFVQLQH